MFAKDCFHKIIHKHGKYGELENRKYQTYYHYVYINVVIILGNEFYCLFL